MDFSFLYSFYAWLCQPKTHKDCKGAAAAAVVAAAITGSQAGGRAHERYICAFNSVVNFPL